MAAEPQAERQTKQQLSVLARWWIYQRERFPLATHAPLIAAFSFCTLSFSMLARGHVALPSLKAVLVAFATALLFFLQMRIADEFKDAEEDARYRPYRPVPRGLVTLRELAIIAVAAGAVQKATMIALNDGRATTPRASIEKVSVQKLNAAISGTCVASGKRSR